MSPCIALCPIVIVVIGVGVDPMILWIMVIAITWVSPIRDMGMVFRVMGLCGGSREFLLLWL